MTRQKLFEQITLKKSFLCIGLDSDLDKIPAHLLSHADPILEFNRQIIDATHDLCVAYKPNIAFYEALGSSGWKTLEKTLEHIPSEHFTIADAKRGDIGNTSRRYAQAFFETLNFHAVTVAPYMGHDSVQPFLEFPGKWVILLALTSNAGGKDFQLIEDTKGHPLYQNIIEKALQWGHPDQLMFVVGATRPEYLQRIRQLVPQHFLLVPGIGAQGGDLQAVMTHGRTAQIGLLVNSSRSILYASNGKDFATKAREKALALQREMSEFFI